MAFQNHRLFLICCGSAIANGLLWYGLSRGANQVASVAPLPELVVDRVTVEKQDPKQPEKLVIHSVVPKPPPKPIAPPLLPHKSEPVRRDTPPPPPEAGSHNKVLIAPPDPTSPKSSNFTALPGGNAKLGDPTSDQKQGNGASNPVNSQPVSTPVQPPPAPAHVDPVPVAPPAPVVPKETPPPPPSPPAPKPKPTGPTQDASPTHQVNPEIPDSLKAQTFKSFVRVKVSISADGSFEVTLRTSSGNVDIDKLVLDSLNKWKWQPALKDGDPVDSVQLFRFNFSID